MLFSKDKSKAYGTEKFKVKKMERDTKILTQETTVLHQY